MSALTALLCGVLGPAALAYDPVIVDDEDGAPGFTTTGDDWTTWGMSGEGFDGSDTEYHYLSHTVGGDDRRGTAVWTPVLPVAGTYLIETWFRRTENRTRDADHVVYDIDGVGTALSIDQAGEGPSGWLSLGEYRCGAGEGGCVVVLDGTDDDESDEANAMRFTLIAEDGGTTAPEDDCSEDVGPGTQTVELYATRVASSSGADDWEDVSRAAGAADGVEAHSPNVDAGEYLRVTGWNVCEPVGDEVIEAVVIGVLGRLQYDTGPYALVMSLDAGGAASTTWSHTSAAWTDLDITGDRGGWSWADLAGVQAQVTLYDHPGGARDSDAWVDAFRMRVTYTIPQPDGGDTAVEVSGDTGGTADSAPPGGGPGGPADSAPPGGGPGGPGGPGDAAGDTAASEQEGAPGSKSCSCGLGGGGGAEGLLLLAVLALARRRAPAASGARP